MFNIELKEILERENGKNEVGGDYKRNYLRKCCRILGYELL